MRNIFFIVIFFICNKCASQVMEYNYLGTLFLSNNSSISFSIHFNEENGVVDGYSLTNIGNPDETKSNLSGIYFKKDKSFQLQETQILSTSSEADLSTFCFIHANLSFKGRLGNKRLEGDFVGFFINNDTCASGKILLMEKEKLEKKIKKVKKKIEKFEEKRATVLKTKQLKDGEDFVVKWENDNLKLFIWDANEEDGDRIRLKINDEIILYDYTTKRKRKKIKYKLKEGENIIEIKAISLGTSPPNTSRIELVDSKTKYPVITQLTLDKSAIISIMK
ncbi:MAG: hypothetical protein QGG97_02905 [Flavobacteriales bacterium]|jgi:hypothetical protein|nr:hypothetical protein [Flavobacteriales bacterium]HJN63175.1 hypothetical protein [Flavobacteriales bacterium]|tara:strand:+ start:586 stop:1419 length:834 start_codon:yes stop_codon:yes gene_type:complete